MFFTGSTKEVCMYYLIKARQRVERLTLCLSTFLLPILSLQEVLTVFIKLPHFSSMPYCMILRMQLFPKAFLSYYAWP